MFPLLQVLLLELLYRYCSLFGVESQNERLRANLHIWLIFANYRLDSPHHTTTPLADVFPPDSSLSGIVR